MCLNIWYFVYYIDYSRFLPVLMRLGCSRRIDYSARVISYSARVIDYSRAGVCTKRDAHG
jgi:hypothetical protein